VVRHLPQRRLRRRSRGPVYRELPRVKVAAVKSDESAGLELEEDLTLFGPETVRIKQSGKDLGRRFQRRLGEICPHCTVPLLMANSKNVPLYCHIFAGHNPTGAKIANDMFGRFLRMG
jgi:hypothetical protein